jgi:hypothetical protein
MMTPAVGRNIMAMKHLRIWLLLSLVALSLCVSCGPEEATSPPSSGDRDAATDEADAGWPDVALNEPAPTDSNPYLFDCIRDGSPCSITETTERGRARQAELHAEVVERLYDLEHSPEEVAVWLEGQEGVARVGWSPVGVKFRVVESVPTHVWLSPEGDDIEPAPILPEPADDDLGLRHSAFSPLSYNLVGGNSDRKRALIFSPWKWGVDPRPEKFEGPLADVIEELTRMPAFWGQIYRAYAEQATLDKFLLWDRADVVVVKTHGGSVEMHYRSPGDDADDAWASTVGSYGLQAREGHVSRGDIDACFEQLMEKANRGEIPILAGPNMEILPVACGTSDHATSFWATRDFFAEAYSGEDTSDTLFFFNACSTLRDRLEDVRGGRSVAEVVVDSSDTSVVFGSTDIAEGRVMDIWAKNILERMRGGMHALEAFEDLCADGCSRRCSWDECIDEKYEFDHYPSDDRELYLQDPDEDACDDCYTDIAQWIRIDVDDDAQQPVYIDQIRILDECGASSTEAEPEVHSVILNYDTLGDDASPDDTRSISGAETDRRNTPGAACDEQWSETVFEIENDAYFHLDPPIEELSWLESKCVQLTLVGGEINEEEGLRCGPGSRAFEISVGGQNAYDPFGSTLSMEDLEYARDGQIDIPLHPCNFPSAATSSPALCYPF